MEDYQIWINIGMMIGGVIAALFVADRRAAGTAQRVAMPSADEIMRRAQMGDQMVALQQQLTAVRRELSAKEREHAEQRGAFNAQIMLLKQQIADFAEKERGYIGEIAMLRATMENLKVDLTRAREALSEANEQREAERAAMQARIDELEKRVTSISGRLDDETVRRQAAEAARDEALDTAATMSAENQRLMREVAELKKQVEDLKKRVQAAPEPSETKPMTPTETKDEGGAPDAEEETSQ